MAKPHELTFVILINIKEDLYYLLNLDNPKV